MTKEQVYYIIEAHYRQSYVATLLAGTPYKADKIVVLGAVINGEPSGGVVLLAVDGGCVVASKPVDRKEAQSYGLLGKQE